MVIKWSVVGKIAIVGVFVFHNVGQEGKILDHLSYRHVARHLVRHQIDVPPLSQIHSVADSARMEDLSWETSPHKSRALD